MVDSKANIAFVFFLLPSAIAIYWPEEHVLNLSMGAIANENGDANRSTENVDPEDIISSNPMVYQLVRVDLDGRLIPATDDELIDVEHFVDDNDLDFDGFGARQSEYVEVDSDENVVKEQMDDLKVSFIQPNLFNTCANSQTTEDCLDIGKKETNEMAEASLSDNYSSSKPNFSLIEGEICLDNFSIIDLQEAFRATFGRRTSIEDKLWLKRRIAMGLTNSCHIPSTSFTIKDSKFVLNNMEEESTSRPQRNLSYSGFIATMSKSTDSLNEMLDKTLSGAASRFGRHQTTCTQEHDNLVMDCSEGDVNCQMDQCSSKRIRKPTKRYIELSEVDAECGGRAASLGKNSTYDRFFYKSKHRRPFMLNTIQDLLGGYETRIPSVLKVRRRRPRKNFLSLVNFVQIERENMCSEVLNSKQSSGEKHEKLISDEKHEKLISEEKHEKLIYSEIASFHDNFDTARTVTASSKRKHHRAWTLGEVLKLVEGVSMYGAGKWSQIRQVAFASCSHRTSVDLKDKWRNLIKASFAQVAADNGIGSSRKPVSLPIPASILLRVRDLASKQHSQSVARELDSSQFVGHDDEFVHEMEMGFL